MRQTDRRKDEAGQPAASPSNLARIAGLTAALLAGVALAGMVADGARAQNGNQQEEEEDEGAFDEAKVLAELNDTDGDLGFHALIDGEGWKKLTIEDPTDARILKVRARGRLAKQGMTELFFESAEPPFDELPPDKFFRRFPEGEYEISGRTLDGMELESTVLFSHVMPAPPRNIRISGMAAADNCDADPLPSVNGQNVVISWDPVTESHPEIGSEGDVEIAGYQVVVEREEPELLILSVDLPPDVTSLTVPDAFIALGDEFKFEILVREENANQTAVESCFEIEEVANG